MELIAATFRIPFEQSRLYLGRQPLKPARLAAGPAGFRFVVYYGDRPGTFRELGTYHVTRRGSKFQSLHYCYQQWPEVLARYDAIMVMDDDIVIDATGITRLFEIRREFDLWALQPAFRLAGKGSWDITAVHATAKLRYTNFIENTCPLFRRDKLDAFLAVYDPELVGYGVDWWFLHTRRINQSSLGAAAGLLRNFNDWAYFNAKRLARRLVPRATRRQR
jgi:hypothetical protein